MDKPIIKYITYAFLVIALFFIAYIFIAKVSASVLCGACFMNIFGPWVAFFIGIIFIIYLLIKIYFEIFSLKKTPSLIKFVLLPIIIYILVSVLLIVSGDLLNVGGPYSAF